MWKGESTDRQGFFFHVGKIRVAETYRPKGKEGREGKILRHELGNELRTGSVEVKGIFPWAYLVRPKVVG